MEIIECPKCGRPRALGHRCPSCGDAATDVDEHPTKESDPWQPAVAQSDPGLPVAAQSATKSSRKIRWNPLIAAVVALAIIAAGIAVPLTRGDDMPEKQEAGGVEAMLQEQIKELTGEEMVHTRPDASENAMNQGRDMQARALLENAMQTMENIIARLDYSGEHSTIDYSTLIREALRSTSSRSVQWVWATPGVHTDPHSDALAEDNTVSWAFIPPSTYELGTWSASGEAIGVRVDRDSGSILFYRNGAEGF